MVIHLRFTQGVVFERLSRLTRDLFGLSIGEGALVNILATAGAAGAAGPRSARNRQRARSKAGFHQACARPRAPDDAVERRHEGDELFSWLRRRGKQAERVEAEAAAILGLETRRRLSEAGQRQQNHQDVDVFAQWDRVVRKVALLTGERIGPEPATGTADERDLSARGAGSGRKAEAHPAETPEVRLPASDFDF